MAVTTCCLKQDFGRNIGFIMTATTVRRYVVIFLGSADEFLN